MLSIRVMPMLTNAIMRQSTPQPDRCLVAN
jgi:hypothetical protein